MSEYSVGDIVAKIFKSTRGDRKVQIAYVLKIERIRYPGEKNQDPNWISYDCTVYKNGSSVAYTREKFANKRFNTYIGTSLLYHVKIPPEINDDEIEEYCQSMYILGGNDT